MPVFIVIPAVYTLAGFGAAIGWRAGNAVYDMAVQTVREAQVVRAEYLDIDDRLKAKVANLAE